MLAAGRGRHACVRMLLQKYHANPNLQGASAGDSALHLGAYHGHVRVIRLLVNRERARGIKEIEQNVNVGLANGNADEDNDPSKTLMAI